MNIFFEMKISFCKNCYLFQLVEQPDKNLMFHDDYMFFSSLSKNMKLHFHNFFNEIKKFLKNSDNPFVIEIGCNDGILLENFKNIIIWVLIHPKMFWKLLKAKVENPM